MALTKEVKDSLEAVRNSATKLEALGNPPKLDYADANLKIFSDAAVKFKNIWSLALVRGAAPGAGAVHLAARQEFVAQGFIIHAAGAPLSKVSDQIGAHLFQQFTSLVKGRNFDNTQWEKVFDAAQKEIKRIHEAAIASIPPIAAPPTPEENERVKRQTDFINNWQHTQLTELNAIRGDVLSNQVTALKEEFNRQEFNAKSVEMMKRQNKAKLDMVRWEKSDEKPIPGVIGIGLINGKSIYSSPPEDGIYYEIDPNKGEKTDSAICLSVSGGSVSIIGENQLLSRNLYARLSRGANDYEPTQGDYEKAFAFIGARMATDRIKIDLSVAESGSLDGFKHIKLMIAAAKKLGMKVTLGSKAEGYLNSYDGKRFETSWDMFKTRKEMRQEVEKLLADVNKAYDNNQKPHEDKDKLYDAASDKKVLASLGDLNQAAAGRAGNPVVAGGAIADPVARENAFLGFDIRAPLAPPLAGAAPGAFPPAAQAELTKVKKRVENLKKASDMLNNEAVDLRQDVKDTQAKLVANPADADAQKRMAGLQQRFNDLLVVKTQYDAEKADLRSRLGVLEGPAHGDVIHAVDPAFDHAAHSFTDQLNSAEVNQSARDVLEVVPAAALARGVPPPAPLPNTFAGLRNTVEAEHKAEVKEAEDRRLGIRP